MATNPGAARGGGKKIEEITYDNLSLRALPLDDSRGPSARTVKGACFSLVSPEPVVKPRLVAAATDALALLGIDSEEVNRPDFAEIFSGNRQLPGWQTAAHCYCGYQFGHFSGQLGDGAAMYIGEVINSQGQRWELQFKGAGPTPYSRTADGRKVLRSSVREFLCSEAMFHLGIPTTRCATCVTSDTLIVRDPLYDGNAIREQCTIITRLAPTFLRFGSFEIFKATDNVTGRQGPSVGMEAQMLPQMLRHTIKTYFTELYQQYDGDGLVARFPVGNEQGWQPLYGDWLAEVASRTASMAAAWQAVGWCHGVLNTDNMSIIGVTLDYGPFGFMDAYDPGHVCNGSDDSARYAFSAQREICRWNCEKLAEALKWAVTDKQAVKVALARYDEEYDRVYNALMRRKLGLLQTVEGEDVALVDSLLQVMAEAGADWTNCWRALARMPAIAELSGPEYEQLLSYLVNQCSPPDVLAQQRGSSIPAENLHLLLSLQKDPGMLHSLGISVAQLTEEVAKNEVAKRYQRMSPQDKVNADKAAWAGWLAGYSSRLARDGTDTEARVTAMNSTNPRYVLRNWMAQTAIATAEKGNYSEVRDLLTLLQSPFSTEGEDAAYAVAAQGATCTLPSARGSKWDGSPPAWANTLCVTCSS